MWSVSNKQFFISKGYNFTSFRKKFKVLVSDLSEGSQCKVQVKCDYCGEIFERTFSSCIKTEQHNLLKKHCCKNCLSLKQREMNHLRIHGSLDTFEPYKTEKAKFQLLESDLEELVINDLHKIENGMRYIDNQYNVEHGTVDILARDKNGVLCIIELKVVDNCKTIIWQCLYYPTQFNENVRVITVCPDYKKYIYDTLKLMPNVELYIYDILDNQIVINNIK